MINFNDKCDHGTKVCANVGGFISDTIRGVTYNSIYYLAKTDDADREPRIEEEYIILNLYLYKVQVMKEIKIGDISRFPVT